MDSQTAAPQFGRRLLPHVIDERARHGHQRPFASIPRGSNAKDGFEDITYARLANAINRCCHWLLPRMRQCDGVPTVAYIGPQDLRYHILSVAAVKCDVVAFYPSPRNSLQAFDALLEETQTRHMLSPDSPLPIVRTLVERRSLTHWVIPSLRELLDPALVQPVLFHGTFEEYRFRPWVYLHTSGSTGTPKIVPIKHGLISAIDAYNLLEVNEPFARYGHMRTLIPFPSFHMAGLNYGLPVMCWIDSTIVMPLPGIPTAEMCHAVHEHGNVEYSILPPSIISDLAKDEACLAELGRLNGIAYSGGPISEETANKVTKHTTLTSSLGATEYGGVPLSPAKKAAKDTNFISFSEDVGGVEFRGVDGQPGLFELVFVKQAHLDLHQPIFVTFPDLSEYHTKDCFSPHPTQPGLWKYEARLDDVLVLSNGEKLNPVSMEGIITSCPEVRGCIVVGQGKFQTALIVEPARPDTDSRELVSALGPYITRANEHCPKYGRISNDLIIVTMPDKPLARAAKGTIQRAPSVRLYRTEIEQLYNAADRVEEQTFHDPLALNSMETTKASLHTHICEHMGIDARHLGSTDDLFAVGMDSLQVLGLVRAINKSQDSAKPAINAAFVYEHPTIEKLANALSVGVTVREYSDFGEDDEFTKQTWEAMEGTYQRLCSKTGKQRGKKSGVRNWPSTFASMLKSHATPPLYQPDGGWDAWKQVLGSFLINVNNWGLVNSFGAYQAFYASNLLSSHSPSNIAWIGTVQGTLLLVVGVVSGPLFDRGYFRSILILAGLGVVLGLMMLSLARSFYSIMLAQGVLIGLCVGLLYIPSIALIPLFFKRKRGLALGIATAGGSFGGVIYPIIFRRLLVEVGFGWANRIMGFVALCMLGLAVTLLRPVGARAPRSLLDFTAFKEPAYVCFMLTGLIIFAGVLAPSFLIVSYASDALSAPENLSFYLLSLLNSAQFFGRILPAILSDWIGPEMLLLAAQVVAGVLAFAWIAVRSVPGFVVWVIVFGFISGMVVTLPAAVLPFLCPSMSVLGTRLGMVYAVAGLGFLISTPVALSLTGSSKSYHKFEGAQLWIGACCIAASGLFAIAAREVWRKRRLYERNVMHGSQYLFRKRTEKELEEKV